MLHTLLLCAVPGRRQRRYGWVGLVCLLTVHTAAWAQEHTPVRFDSVRVRAGSVVNLADSVLFVVQDTVLMLPDTLVVEIQEAEEAREAAFYDSLRVRASQGWLSKALYNLLVVSSATGFDTVSTRFYSRERDFEPYAGREIRQVHVRGLDVFGPTLARPYANPVTPLTEFLNYVHINTAEKVLRSNLLFAAGDHLDPHRLADTERILRALPYIEDARIRVLPVGGREGPVDIVVLAKDLWSIGARGDVSGGALRATAFDVNFLGTGNRIEGSVLINPNKKPALGFDTWFRVDNFRGNFVELEARYADNYERRIAQVFGQRRFVSPVIHYVGGFDVNRTLLYDNESDTTLNIQREGYDLQNAWAGRVLPLAGRRPTSLIASAKVERKHYNDRPLVGADTNRAFHHALRLLGSVTLLSRAYYQTSLLYGFGRVEDVPVGYLVQAVGGWEAGEFFDRPYVGGGATGAVSVVKGSYLLGEVAVGGYVRDRRFEDGVLQVDGTYITPLTNLVKFGLRHFVSASYTLGINQPYTRTISLRGRYGTKALRGERLESTERLSVQLETVLFTPWNLLGFRFALFGFADLGWLGAGGPLFRHENFYPGLGLGLRTQNERLIVNTLQLSVVFNPIPPPDRASWGIYPDLPPRLGINALELVEPSIVPFE